MSQAARSVSASICRLPIRVPVARSIAALASSNEPRTASIAAKRRSPKLARSIGRFSRASIGCRFDARSAR
jgi:hypothetical protein